MDESKSYADARRQFGKLMQDSLKERNKLNLTNMKYEDLDSDTRGIIDSMVFNTGKTREKSILALVELGMMSMIASVRPDKKEKIMQIIFDAVNNDDKLKKTAMAYKAYWDINV